MYDEISVAIDNYNVTVDTFLDLSKAFETADPNILLNKLFHYANLGVTGINIICSIQQHLLFPPSYRMWHFSRLHIRELAFSDLYKRFM